MTSKSKHDYKHIQHLHYTVVLSIYISFHPRAQLFHPHLLLELSVGMTTEGIEVRSVGNTKVWEELDLWTDWFLRLVHFQQTFLQFLFSFRFFMRLHWWKRSTSKQPLNINLKTVRSHQKLRQS